MAAPDGGLVRLVHHGLSGSIATYPTTPFDCADKADGTPVGTTTQVHLFNPGTSNCCDQCPFWANGGQHPLQEPPSAAANEPGVLMLQVASGNPDNDFFYGATAQFFGLPGL